MAVILGGHRDGVCSVGPHHGQRFAVVGIGHLGAVAAGMVGAGAAQSHQGAALHRHLHGAPLQRLEDALVVGVPQAQKPQPARAGRRLFGQQAEAGLVARRAQGMPAQFPTLGVPGHRREGAGVVGDVEHRAEGAGHLAAGHRLVVEEQFHRVAPAVHLHRGGGALLSLPGPAGQGVGHLPGGGRMGIPGMVHRHHCHEGSRLLLKHHPGVECFPQRRADEVHPAAARADPARPVGEVGGIILVLPGAQAHLAQIVHAGPHKVAQQAGVVLDLLPEPPGVPAEGLGAQDQLDTLEAYPQVDYAMGLANTEAIGGYMLTDALNPRQLSEAAGLDYELTTAVYALYAAENDNLGNLANLDEYQVPLLDLLLFLCDKADSGAVTLDSAMQEELDTIHSQLRMAQDQLQGTAYDRLVVALALPEEGEETLAFLQTLHDEAARFYGPDAVLLVGNSTSDYDLATTFAQDNILISVLSAVFVVIVLLFTFQSAGLPLLLILVIQGSIWLNFSVPALTGDYVFFMSYLIVTAIQMGANIDYAIVVSTRYRDCKAQMPPKSAVVEALNLAFPTTLTSGSILTAAAFLIGCITPQPYIAGIGECLCRGTLLSLFLVLFILPQILVPGDSIVERTRFALQLPTPRRQEIHGAVRVDGRVRGYVHGYVDGTLHGTIRGDATLQVAAGKMGTLPPKIDLPPEPQPTPSPDVQEEPSDETTD